MKVDELLENLGNRRWRLRNLYYIINERGEKVKFTPNASQELFLDEMHNLNVILKARQIGYSTIIQLLMLDACVFNSNVNAGVIAQSLPDAEEIFRSKIKFPYENLPKEITDRIRPTGDSKKALELSNGSQIRVGTSLRGTTLNWLHVSEYGKICAKMPERAKEIRTGALNTVHTGQAIFVESTAEGREGDFYEMCRIAEDWKLQGKPLSPLDFKFHFAPWWKDPKYTLHDAVAIPTRLAAYFKKLELEEKITLTAAQKAWYVKKEALQREEMKREFPSTSKEAFEQSMEGAYFAAQMQRAREEGRLGSVKYRPDLPVNTFWDLGIGDNQTIWFHQQQGMKECFIDYYENSGEHFPHYAQYLQSKKYVYGKHYLPHDATTRDKRQPGSLYEDAVKLLQGEVYRVPRVPQKQTAINAARNVLGQCWFDELKCEKGIKCLDAYRKEWNEDLGTWRDTPRHDWASHGADGFMTFALAKITYENEYEDDDGDGDGYNRESGRSRISGY